MKYEKRPIEWVVTENGCYECTSHKLSSRGYPKCSDAYGKITNMMRHIYEQCFGEIPKGMCICHKCDNPKCINIEHLFLGTPTDNMRDRNEKNRQAQGERCFKSKISDKQRAEIIAENKLEKKPQKELALKYGVSQKAISQLLLKAGSRRRFPTK